MQDIIREIYEELKSERGGNVADYIPQLAAVDPDLFGVSVCTVDGETYSMGDSTHAFCLQSCCKPLNYCLARTNPELDVHSCVGYEPSGQGFNSFILNRDGLPHNPMINAGAIMVSSLIDPDREPSHRFETVRAFYTELSGGVGSIGFDNSVFLSERHHADRNTSLAYYMRENKAFQGDPSPNDILGILDLYFQCCSVTVTCDTAATMIATLANGGVNPVTQKRILSNEIVQDCLSLMFACGMYDFSGQFAFKIGLPAKSGVSGGLFLVVPNQCGICIWSPRLDGIGNSVRGVEFCKRFVERTKRQYHIFSTVTTPVIQDDTHLAYQYIQAASTGNLAFLQANSAKVPVNVKDYDGRTPLHLAVAEGNKDVIAFLIQRGENVHATDRWGHTPQEELGKIGRVSEELLKVAAL